MKERDEKTTHSISTLLSDPELQREAARNEAEFRKAAAPVLRDLEEAGVHATSLEELATDRRTIKKAAPVLLAWLPRIANPSVRHAVVGRLATRNAPPEVARALIAYFRSGGDELLKWGVASAIEHSADDRCFDDIVETARDRAHGKAREMLVVALGKMTDPRAVDVLLELLDDDEVDGHAIVALGKLRAPRTRERIAAFLTHPRSWVRREAKKALAAIDRVGAGKP